MVQDPKIFSTNTWEYKPHGWQDRPSLTMFYGKHSLYNSTLRWRILGCLLFTFGNKENFVCTRLYEYNLRIFYIHCACCTSSLLSLSLIFHGLSQFSQTTSQLECPIGRSSYSAVHNTDFWLWLQVRPPFPGSVHVTVALGALSPKQVAESSTYWF